MKITLILTAFLIASCGGTATNSDDASEETKTDQITGATISVSGDLGQDVQITPGAEVANDVCGAYLQIPEGEIEPAGPSVEISTVLPAMTLAIPLDDPPTLMLADYDRLIVIYATPTKIGLIPRSQLTVADQKVVFEPPHAGRYQPAYVPLEYASTPIEGAYGEALPPDPGPYGVYISLLSWDQSMSLVPLPLTSDELIALDAEYARSLMATEPYFAWSTDEIDGNTAVAVDFTSTPQKVNKPKTDLLYAIWAN